MSIELNASEKLGSVKIPNVGELAKVKRLTTISDSQAEELLKELRL